jgi:mannonate dehydratase
MDRRQFMLTSAIAPIAVLPGAAAGARPAPASRLAYKMKLGCQSTPSNDEHFAFFARYGVTNICAQPQIADGRAYPTVDELAALKAMAERHGLIVDMVEPPLLPSSHIDREKHPAIMLADSPERDRDIEAFAKTLRNSAAVGIPCVKYNMSLLGVLRTGSVQGRGDAHYMEWDLKKAHPATPLTRAGVVDADHFWQRITYFLKAIVPVANETKVRIACHPHDPGVPPEGYQGVDRVLGTIDGLKRFVQIEESPYHGLNFCQGTISENLVDPGKEIFDVIRWFGARNKIFNVHFRNIQGGRDRFNESFPDEGSVDMVRALRTYAEVGYDGMIMSDHVPGMDDPAEQQRQRLQNFAFCYGYIRGLIQSAQRLA